MAANVNLPPGFVLDDEEQKPSNEYNLPAGFVLDDDKTEKKGEFVDNIKRDVKEWGKNAALSPVAATEMGVEFLRSGPPLPLPLQSVIKTPLRQQTDTMVGGLLKTGKELVTDPAGSFYRRPVSTTMDILSIGIPAARFAAPRLMGRAANALESVAQTQGGRALGFTKRFLKDKRMAADARDSAQVLLDEGVITPLASAETMAERRAFLAQESGKAIGNFLKSLSGGKGAFNPQEAIDALETMRPNVPKMGEYAKIHSKIDNAIETIKAHGLFDAEGKYVGLKPMAFDEANRLKGVLQDAANWMSNKEATVLDKRIAGSFRKSLDTSLEKVAEEAGKSKEFAEFKQQKRIFKATQQAEDPLYNRISSQTGNQILGLDDLIVAIPGAVKAGTLGATATVGGLKFLQRFGNQTTAVIANRAAKLLRMNPGSLGKYAPLLRNAAERGAQTFMATNEMLAGRDPQYLEILKKAQ